MKAPRTARKSKRPAAPSSQRAKAKAPAPSLTDDLEQLASLLRRHDLTELEVESGDLRVRLGRAPGPAMGAVAPPPPLPSESPSPLAPPSTAAKGDGNVSYITSPFVGTFYRSPGPESAPFVDVDTHVKKGQVLCIVEAMKLMNEIESEVAGTIVQILVDNGHPVEYGEPLFKIRQG